ncbi:DUF4234 domain-containing protein [Brachyspira hampsonii]|uniref:DUF4234 domain-containing protein n=1 Tax=Brachyspira hampsonii TaxID=1287055 RepID=A0AAC9TUB8_9SPIR|nr:DUF4234 domain-containing protein [Brachyspira hampsonii]ASJ21367.1 hypothetical protein BHAMNSH16_06805 [Brachyspira hampsonii]ELV04809.1 hypothetical protein H263_13955 [Brachyspira hampsonii 30599]MBW5379858.1 DUF4234 domain-containing protein [Brachyspira hampsonii]OEJ17692.1 hypothetical protein A9496_10315 [Brachyspira hampsonii]
MTKGTVRSIPMLVILSIVTCGIYYLYWIYKTTDEIKNFMGREDINSALELILVLVTCNIYSLYWYYKYGKIVYLEMTAKVGMDNSEDSSVLLVILGLLVYVVAGAILQDKLNSIWNKVDDTENTTTHNIESN